MPIYVDNSIYPYGRMIMCHMTADTEEELHGMAGIIGIQKKWFQNKPRFPHYDICKAKRALAVEAGAVELTAREMVDLARRLRSCP